MSQINANTQTDELKESQLNLLSLMQHLQFHPINHLHCQPQQVQPTSSRQQQHQISNNSFNFDFISSMATSQVSLDNQSLRPKILKMIDTIQTYLDLNNEKLIEQIGKHREHELIDLAKKSSDLNHRQKLQSLLIESINSNDFRKASFIHSYLGDQPMLNQFNTNNSNETNYNQFDDTNMNNNFVSNTEPDDEFNMNEYDSSPVKNELYFNNTSNNNTSSNTNIDFDDENNNTINIQLPIIGNSITSTSNKPTNSQSCTSESITLNDSIRDAFAKVKKPNPLSPIRHLICSPGLESKAQNCKIIILYRGRCNGICYQNKPWSKEMHIHYIINTVNCNDHVSRLVKKQGIQFYNSFVLQNQERIKQLIQMYKMEKV